MRILRYFRAILINYHSCALMNGIDPAIVERANEIATLSYHQEDLVAACAQMTPPEMKDLEDAVRVSNTTFIRCLS